MYVQIYASSLIVENFKYFKHCEFNANQRSGLEE